MKLRTDEYSSTRLSIRMRALSRITNKGCSSRINYSLVPKQTNWVMKKPINHSPNILNRDNLWEMCKILHLQFEGPQGIINLMNPIIA